jgi:S-(hydroxymethyl)glutathione dehydrogenase/alcohol dehydrogenase
MSRISGVAAVLFEPNTPLSLETVHFDEPVGDEVLVRVRAAGICHTDLEAVEGALRYPIPIIPGHEAAGEVCAVGPDASSVRVGDHVVLSWNPSCGDCFYCGRGTPILCETYLREMAGARSFAGRLPVRLSDGRAAHQLMFLGAFSEYCLVSEQQAIAVPAELPFDQACLIGCGVMTGFGGATKVAGIAPGDVTMVIGCGAVGLAAVQGARQAGAECIIAVDTNDARLDLAVRLARTIRSNPRREDPAELARSLTAGRGADVVIECAGRPSALRTSVEAVRPGGSVVWLGKLASDAPIEFRWGSLMQEKRIRRNSYGGAEPARDFPALARAALNGGLALADLISHRIALDDVNPGLDRLRRGDGIRSVIVL